MKTWKLFTTSDGGISAEGPEISIDLEVEVIEKSAYDELAKALTKAAYMIDQDHSEDCADQNETFGPNETCECRAIERRAHITEIQRLLHVG